MYSVLVFTYSTLYMYLHSGGVLTVVNQRYIATALDTTFRPELIGEPYSERFLIMRHNVFPVVASCVQPSTQDTYASGWKRSIGFCNW